MRLRHVIVATTVWVLVGAAASAQAPDPQVIAPIQKFIDTFNKGDSAGAASTHVADAHLVIVDEVSPYAWRGAKAFEAWATDLDTDSKKQGITDQNVKLGAATRVETNGNQAYVIVPTVYTFKQRGVPMRAAAQMTVVLQKGPGGWLIHGWTWTGPRAKPVGKAAKTQGQP